MTNLDSDAGLTEIRLFSLQVYASAGFVEKASESWYQERYDISQASI